MTPTKLKLIREEKGMTRAALAKAACMGPTMISWIETGRFIPYPNQLLKLAAVLDVKDPAELVTPIRIVIEEVGDDE